MDGYILLYYLSSITVFRIHVIVCLIDVGICTRKHLDKKNIA